MKKLKVALLEDTKALLKELKENVEATGLVEAVAWATDSEDFIEKVRQARPDALIMDIDLAGDQRTGIDVAQKLALPVLFVSGKTTEFNSKIEFVDVQSDFIVDRIGKPYSQLNLRNKLSKFVATINAAAAINHIYLDVLHNGRIKVDVNSIVYITSKDEISNNKTVYFKDRKPETLIDFTLKLRENYGFARTIFIDTHKQYCVNKNHIIRKIDNDSIEVEYMLSNGLLVMKSLPVSDNYRSVVNKALR